MRRNDLIDGSPWLAPSHRDHARLKPVPDYLPEKVVRRDVDRHARRDQWPDLLHPPPGQQHGFHWIIASQQPPDDELAFSDKPRPIPRDLAVLEIAIGGDARVFE